MSESTPSSSAANTTSRPDRPSGWLIALAAIVLSVGAFFAIAHFGHRGDPELHQRVARLQRVVWLGSSAPEAERANANLLAERDQPELKAALDHSEPHALIDALQQRQVDGLLVAFSPKSKLATVRDKLHGYGHVRGLRADYLTARWALYTPDPLQSLSPQLQDALATVARGVLGGQRAPRVTSFPETLRRVQNVEVMVLVRRDGRALLWRSARGSSIARSLLTAAQMARRRWMEREQALGGSLDRLLPKLEIEVGLLHEDGTLADRDPAFVDRVFGPDHGVAYERRGSWHYSLPEATQRDGHGFASKAYAKLFEDNGLPASSLEREDVRLYRMAVTTLAVSPATDTGEDDPARVQSPDDVLGLSP